jgi:hypothetical protein
MNRITVVLLILVVFCGCSSQPRYRQTNHPPFTFDTKKGLDCWAKATSLEREKARAAAADPKNPINQVAPEVALIENGGVYDPKDYPYCSDLK